MRKRSIFDKTDEITISCTARKRNALQKYTKTLNPQRKIEKKQSEASYDENYRVSFKIRNLPLTNQKRDPVI